MATATEPSIEQRLAALEAAVAEILQHLNGTRLPVLGWLEQVKGSMKDQPAFKEAVALGRAFREAHHPPDDEGSGAQDKAPEVSSSDQVVPPDPAGTGQDLSEPTATSVRIKRAKLDDQGRLIPLTPAEAQAEAESIRQLLDERRSMPSDPDEDDAEFFRAMDSHRPHRPLFEGLY